MQYDSLPTKKYCRGCKTAKDFSAFYKNNYQNKTFGIMSRCKVCTLLEKKKQRERKNELRRLDERLRVLDRMAEFKLIGEDEAEVTKSEELEIFRLSNLE